MKSQIPADGIYKQHDWGNTVSYGVPCECTSEDHQHTIWVEADDAGVTVTTYTTQQTNFWSLNRFKIIWTLLIKGHVEYQASLIMSKQQAFNYAETLKKAVNNVEQFQQDKHSK
jgi:hypothetical protein